MATNSIHIDVFTAIDNLITQNGTLMSMITGYFQQPPTAQPFPYVTLGHSQRVPWNAFENLGSSMLIPLDIWTDIRDGDNALLILAELDAMFDNKKLNLPNFWNVLIYNELTVDMPEEGQELRHLAARYRAISSIS